MASLRTQLAWTVKNAQRSPFGVLGLEESQVGLPLVPDDFAAGEATNRDDHLRAEGFNFRD